MSREPDNIGLFPQKIPGITQIVQCYWCVAVDVALCCSVLQCIAACCSVLQRVAVCCSVLQRDAVRCSDSIGGSFRQRCLESHKLHSATDVLQWMLQCVAVCCSVLQCVAVCCSVWSDSMGLFPKKIPRLHRSHSATDVLQWVLQCVAVCCSMWQWLEVIM